MSGHSKWHRIHRQKGVTDAKRGALFTRLGKAITIAAKEGGGQLETNFKLRLAVDQAKASNMPKDNIERAIKRGTGEMSGGVLEEVTYEGFGPAKVGFIVECVTDNRNRTAASIKHLFSKLGEGIASPNSIKWQFEKRGSVGILGLDEETELALIDAGATDIKKDKEGVTIFCEPAKLERIKKLLEEKNITLEFAEIGYFSNNEKEITNEGDKKKLENFISELEENEDVNNYYLNAKT